MSPALPAAFREAVRELDRGSGYLVGVSGGRDSVALLHWLRASGFERLAVCHLDHGLRGADGEEDRRFVEQIAARLGCPFLSDRADVAAAAAERGCSVEMMGRELRHRLFAAGALRFQMERLFLAHHADDQVETALFRLFRGAGGAAGMLPEMVLEMNGLPVRVLRPMLGVWREEIDAWFAESQAAWREDVTNAGLDPVRNRIRHRLIPGIEALFGRPVRGAVWRAAALAAEESRWLDERLPGDWRGERLSVAVVLGQEPALQRRLVRRWLLARGVADLSFSDVESVREVASGRRVSANLARDAVVRAREGALELSAARPAG